MRYPVCVQYLLSVIILSDVIMSVAYAECCICYCLIECLYGKCLGGCTTPNKQTSSILFLNLAKLSISAYTACWASFLYCYAGWRSLQTCPLNLALRSYFCYNKILPLFRKFLAKIILGQKDWQFSNFIAQTRLRWIVSQWSPFDEKVWMCSNTCTPDPIRSKTNLVK